MCPPYPHVPHNKDFLLSVLEMTVRACFSGLAAVASSGSRSSHALEMTAITYLRMTVVASWGVHTAGVSYVLSGAFAMCRLFIIAFLSVLSGAVVPLRLGQPLNS